MAKSSSAPKGTKSKFSNAKSNNNPDTKIRSIKCGLKSILRRNLTKESKQEILRVISAKSIAHTWLWHLASLQFLFRVNDNFDRENWAYFDKDNAQATKEIENCFKSVLSAHVNNEQYEMPPLFRQLCQQYHSQFPDLTMDNPFIYACATYERNCTTNLKCHEKNRVGKFLRLTTDRLNREEGTQFTQKDIDNTMEYVFEGEFTTRQWQEVENVEFLSEILVRIGAPSTGTITEFREAHWFKSLPMWLFIQRAIEEENVRRSQSMEHEYKLSNFSAVPLCGFTRKFVEIDNKELYAMMKQWNLLPKDYSKSKKGRFIEVQQFNLEKELHWNSIFDMENIRNLSCHQFRYHMLSDGVSVVLHFDKPKPPLSESIAADIIKQKIDNNTLDYEIGMDPGMRTYMAVVRRDVRTGAEVCSSKSHITVNSRIEIFSNE